MTRKIFCEPCARLRYRLTDVDRFNGYCERVEEFEVHTPAQHGYHMAGSFIPGYEVICDNCGQTLHNGHRAVAVTVWKSKGFQAEAEPERWEMEFGARLS